MLLRLAFFLGLVATVGGCTRSSDTTVQDALGRPVALPDTVRRVVALAPNLTEVAFAAGAGARVVGASTSDDYPPEAEGLPRFSTYPVDFEAIVALRPDLVLATDQVNAPADGDRLAELGIPAYFFSFETLEDVGEAIRTTGNLLGTEVQAEAATEAFLRALDQTRTRPAPNPRPLVLLLVGDGPLFAFGGESYTQELIRTAGGRSATGDLPGQSAVLDPEFVLGEAPDLIVLATKEAYDAEAFAAKQPALASLDAVRRGHVYAANPDWIFRPGPRLAEGARQLADLVRRAAEEG